MKKRMSKATRGIRAADRLGQVTGARELSVWVKELSLPVLEGKDGLRDMLATTQPIAAEQLAQIIGGQTAEDFTGGLVKEVKFPDWDAKDGKKPHNP